MKSGRFWDVSETLCFSTADDDFATIGVKELVRVKSAVAFIWLILAVVLLSLDLVELTTAPELSALKTSIAQANTRPTRQLQRKPMELIVKMANAPYPYRGPWGDTDLNFYDFVDSSTSQRYRTSRNGERYSESEHFSDNRVLFFVPRQFNPNHPITLLVFFHGILSSVQSAIHEHKIEDQIEDSGRNVILIAPQLAFNATDTSPGKFFQKNAFRKFMDEAARHLAGKLGAAHLSKFLHAPIILVAFSGGYKSAAYVLNRGGEESRIKGVLLLDALYDDVDKYLGWWLKNNHHSFLLHIYTNGTCAENSEIFKQHLTEYGFSAQTIWPAKVIRRTVVFVHSDAEHQQVPVMGPPESPVTKMLVTLDY